MVSGRHQERKTSQGGAMFVCVDVSLKEQFTETMSFNQHLHIPMQVSSQVKCKHKTENGFVRLIWSNQHSPNWFTKMPFIFFYLSQELCKNCCIQHYMLNAPIQILPLQASTTQHIVRIVFMLCNYLPSLFSMYGNWHNTQHPIWIGERR